MQNPDNKVYTADQRECTYDLLGIKFYKRLLRVIKRLNHREIGEVTKSVWGMPRLSEAKKDVISCDKLWVGAHDR